MLIPLAEVLARHAHRIPAITGILHLGAHTGEEAQAYADCLAGVPVWWVEGNPQLMGQLINHVQPYGHHCINALVGAEDDAEVTFNIANNGQSSSVLPLGTHRQASPDVHYTGTQSHTLITVDTLAEKYRISGANLINADLQGFELEALKGAERTLALADLLYLEVNVDPLYKGCVLLPELDEWLDCRGFERVEMLLAGNPRRGPGWVGWGDGVYVRRDP
jgi:FkbM family methyltransferase